MRLWVLGLLALCPGTFAQTGRSLPASLQSLMDHSQREIMAKMKEDLPSRQCHNECSHRGPCISGTCICPPGFGGDDCSQEIPQCLNACSGHGLCEKSDSGYVCNCFGGYLGDDCSQEVSACPNGCSGRGTCQLDPPLCACAPGYGGVDCSAETCVADEACGTGRACVAGTCQCLGGLWSANCSKECPSRCSGRGMCVGGECFCDKGWYGPACTALTGRYPDATLLSPPPQEPHVTAEVFVGILSSSTDFTTHSWPVLRSNIAARLHLPVESLVLLRVLPRHRPSARDVGLALSLAFVCDPATQRAVMDAFRHLLHDGPAGLDAVTNIQSDVVGGVLQGTGVQTVELLATASDGLSTACPADCSGHGDCIGDVCVCEDGWFGAGCSTQNECEAGCPSPKVCDLARKGCVCPRGFSGQWCDHRDCDPVDCNLHGTCINGTCKCDEAWTGASCDVQDLCDGIPLCSGHGQCQLDDSATPARKTCVCDRDYHGVDCHAHLPCPRDCSGHGLCDRGTCLCDQGYTDTDCGEAVKCPRDCMGHGQCVLGTCYCNTGYSSYDCSRRLPSCPNGCSGAGSCVNGTCVCQDKYSGVDCSVFTNTSTVATCPRNCSGHGRCRTGRCTCYPGWRGDACDEVDVACPNRCSGAGVCQADGTCLCEAGRGGPDCSMAVRVARDIPCPSNCSGNGLCALGSCACSPGFLGADCSRVAQHCPQHCSGMGRCARGVCICKDGYSGDGCGVPSLSRYRCPNNCTGNGRCEGLVCVCDLGYTGNDCSRLALCRHNCSGHGLCIDGACVCKPGYGSAPEDGPTDCSRVVPLCPAMCSGHGVCYENGQCRCDRGYTGPACANAVQCPLNCSGRGICSADGECVCDLGFGGAACTTRLRSCGHCPNHSRCNDGLCVCVDGWSGEGCSTAPPPTATCPTAHHLLECSGHGTCVQLTCQCDAGFYGADCSFLCPANCSNSGADTHGQCDQGNCTCVEPWSGADCSVNRTALLHAVAFMHTPAGVDTPYTFLVQEDAGAGSSADSAVPTPAPSPAAAPATDTSAPPAAGDGSECPLACSGRGVCIKGLCECDVGYGGHDCSVRRAVCPNMCSGNGWCDVASGKCVCARGHFHEDCSGSHVSIPVEACPVNCSGNGLCQDGRCNCNRETSGHACNVYCPKGCSSNGVCVHGACLCAPYYHGDDCGLFRPPAESPANRVHLPSTAQNVPPQRAVTPAAIASDDEDLTAFTRELANAIREETTESRSVAHADMLMSLVQMGDPVLHGGDDDVYEKLLRDELAKDGAI